MKNNNKTGGMKNTNPLNETTQKNKKQNGLLILLAVIALIAFGAAAVLFWTDKSNRDTKEQEENQQTSEANQRYITYNGEKYIYNSNLKTMLFLGVDKEEVATVHEYAGQSGQSDCIILLVLDQEEKTIRLLEVSRDSMADIDIYDMDGNFMATETAQIALQYAYGKGEKDSCRLSVDAVSKLLYQIRINDYLSLNIAGVPSIVDSVGGVEITIPQDYTAIDPAFAQGAVLTLNGEQAEKYIRYRDLNVHGSNNDRMERQTQFIQALFEKISHTDDGGLEMLHAFWNSGQDYMTTNLDLNTLEKLTSYTMQPDIIKVPGEVRVGEQHDEFYVDEQELQKIIIDTFYTKL